MAIQKNDKRTEHIDKVIWLGVGFKHVQYFIKHRQKDNQTDTCLRKTCDAPRVNQLCVIQL